MAKTVVMSSAPYETNLFLDADTLVVDRIHELLDVSTETECLATQFSNWTTQRRVIRKRLNSWEDVRSEQFTEEWMKDTINAALMPQAAVNTGVVAFRQNATILAPWRELTHAGRKKFICDEIAFQLLLNRYPHRILDCRFNCSPTHAGKTSDVRIWHFHGDKHVRRESGRQIWMPAYDECVRENVAEVADWSPDADACLRDYLSSTRADFSKSRSTAQSSIAKTLRNEWGHSVVTFVNRKTCKQLQLTLPTWNRKPDISGSELLVFYSEVTIDDLHFVDDQWGGPVRFIEASSKTPDEALEVDAKSFLIDAPAEVETDHWIKLEPHVLFVDSQPLFPRKAFKVDVFGHRWSYTRPAFWLDTLDQWFKKSQFASYDDSPASPLVRDEDADKIAHKRLTSWASVQRTSFTQQVADELGTSLPIPSHDTTLWYVAQRSAQFTWNAANLQKRGALRCRSLRKLRERATGSRYENGESRIVDRG